MGGGGGKGGTQTTVQKTELPPWVQAEAARNIGIANEVAVLPYMPNRGPTIAGFTPHQIEAMRGTNDLAQTFGQSALSTPDTMTQDQVLKTLTGLDAPVVNNQGVRGYSPYESYKVMMDQMNPYHKAFLESFFTGERGQQPSNPRVKRSNFNQRAFVNQGITDQGRFRYTPETNYVPPGKTLQDVLPDDHVNKKTLAERRAEHAAKQEGFRAQRR